MKKNNNYQGTIDMIEKIRKSMQEVPVLKPVESKPVEAKPIEQPKNTLQTMQSAVAKQGSLLPDMSLKSIALGNVSSPVENTPLQGKKQGNTTIDKKSSASGMGKTRGDSDDSFIQKALDPNYKLTKDEKKRAQKIISNYENEHANDANPNATELVFDEAHPDGYMKPIGELSEEEKAKQENIYALRDKISKGESALIGAMRSTPGVSALERKGGDYWKTAEQNAQRQNPLSYYGGLFGNGILMNAVGQGLLGDTKYGEAVKNAVGVGKEGISEGSNVVRNVIADALMDAPVDLATDIIPELAYDIADKKSGKEIAKNLAANIGLNAGLNLGASALGNLDDILSLRKGITTPDVKVETPINADVDASKVKNITSGDVNNQRLKVMAEEADPDNVVYHSGTLSRLNKAETRGKMSEGTRDTGYFGTGHYFVDKAHKAELDSNSNYRTKPYTSVDISKYDNLYKADTDAKASKLHDFSQRFMRYINKHNDKYFTDAEGRINTDERAQYIDDLYSRYVELFPEQSKDRALFETELDNYRANHRDVKLDDRGDSEFTQFMKEMGYNGVDTRGTRSANTERGVVIYDLDDDSILQSNVNDADTKRGLMNNRVRNEGQDLFDTNEDKRIGQIIDKQEKNKAILNEYHRIYDDSYLKNIERDISNTSKDIDNLENNARPYYYALLNDEKALDKEVNRRLKEFEEFGLESDAATERASLLSDAEKNISEIDTRLDELKKNLNELHEELKVEETNSWSAYEEASKTVSSQGADANRVTLEETNNIPSQETRVMAESASVPETNEVFDSIESNPLNERGMSRHMRGEGKMQMEGVPDEVKSDFIDDPDLYEVLSNAETKDIADDVYMSGDAPVSINGKEYTGDVETKFRTMLAEHNPSALPLGHQLAKDYSAAGNYEMAAQIYRDMGEQLTKSGQFSQAAILAMVKDDPMTALTYAERELDSLNRAGREQFGKGWKDLAFTKDELDAFNNIKPGDKDAIKELFDKIGARLGREYPTTMMEKLIEGRKIAMLFNMRTMVRNVLANPPTLGMRWASDRLEALGQNIVHIIDPSFQKTQSLIGGGINGRRLANEVANSSTYENLINGTSGKYEVPDIRNSLMKNKQMFKGTAMSKFINKFTNGGIEKLNDELFGKQGVESGLETVRNLTYKLLDLGDSPFVRENFVERLGSYINAQGIKSVDDIPPEAIETAWEAALKATYKDNSWAVQALRGMRNSIAKIPGVGKPLSQAAIPFLQAPANIGARMVEYSPVNSAVGIKDLVSGIAKKDHKAIEKGIERISKGTTGAGMVYLGMKLREAGILTGDYAQNKRQKEMQKMDGFKPWSLKVGDKYFQYNWAQPFAENLIVGTLMQDAIDNSDEYDSDILKYFGYEGSDLGKKGGALFQGSKAAVQSWVDETPIQNLLEMFGANSGGYGESDIAQSIIDNGAGDFAGALVPATVNAIAKTNDPTVRNTYDPSNAFATYLNQQQAKIPGLTKDLPAKYDLWGRESKYADSKWGAFLQKFVSPGEIGKETTDPIDQELNALFERTQKESVFPTYAPHKVDETKLTNVQESAYQKDMGQRNRAIVENFVNSDAYKSMPDDVKVEALSTVYNASKAITERDLFNKAVADNSSYKKLIAAYDEAGGGEAGAKAMADLVTQRQITSAAGLTNDSKFRASVEEDLASGNLEEANRKLSDFEILKSNGVNSATAAYMYDRQLKNNYNISPEEFGKTWVLMDTNGKEGINQDEAIAYMNKNKMSQSEGMKIWNAYGDWKTVPVLEKGTWKKAK